MSTKKSKPQRIYIYTQGIDHEGIVSYTAYATKEGALDAAEAGAEEEASLRNSGSCSWEVEQIENGYRVGSWYFCVEELEVHGSDIPKFDGFR